MSYNVARWTPRDISVKNQERVSTVEVFTQMGRTLPVPIPSLKLKGKLIFVASCSRRRSINSPPAQLTGGTVNKMAKMQFSSISFRFLPIRTQTFLWGS